MSSINSLVGVDLSELTAEAWDAIDLQSSALPTGQLGFVTAISSNSRGTDRFMQILNVPTGVGAERLVSRWNITNYKRVALTKREEKQEIDDKRERDKRQHWQEVRMKAMGSQYMIERAQEKWSRCPDEFETDKTLFNYAMDYTTDIMDMPDDFCGEEMSDDDLLLLTYMDALIPKEFIYNNTFDCHEDCNDNGFLQEFKNIKSTSPEIVKGNIAVYILHKVTKDVSRDLSTACRNKVKGDPKYISSISMNFGFDAYRESLIQSVYLECKGKGIQLTSEKEDAKKAEGKQQSNTDCTSLLHVPFSINNLEQAAKFCAFVHLLSSFDTDGLRVFLSSNGDLKFDSCLLPLAEGLQAMSITPDCDLDWRGGDSLVWFNLYLLARIVKWTGSVIPSALLDAILSPTVAKIKRQTNLYMHYFTTYTSIFL